MAGSRTLKLSILADIDNLKKNLNSADKEIQGFGGKLADFGKKAAIALAAVGAAAGAMAIKIGKEAIAAASDLAETTSKVNVIFGETSKSIEEFGAKAAQSLGQTRTQAMNAAATFGIFGKSAGLAGEELGQFSTEFVQLASDLASFNNTAVDQAITALGAALRGESEPIRAYGVLLNDATLKAKALEMGIYSGTGTLSAQQKVLAAHKVILEQTRDAQGDFARTADGMANSQRILSARLEDTKIVLGNALLPIALQVVNLFNDRFLPVIERLASSFGGGDGVIAQIQSFVNTARNALAPVIEALQSSFNKVSEAVSTNRGNLQSFLTLIQTLYSFFVTYLVPILKNQVVSAIQGIGTAFSVAIKAIAPIVGVISSAISGILNIIDTAIRRINDLIRAYNKIPLLPNIPIIGGDFRYGAQGGSKSETRTITKSVSKTTCPSGKANYQQTLLGGAVVNEIFLGCVIDSGSTTTTTTDSSTTTSTNSTTSSKTTTKEITSQTKNASAVIKESVADWMPSLITVADIVARERGDVINYPTVSAAPGAFDVARVRMGEAGITINVSAPSAIDEEGFKRAVVDALNESANRGTGGGGGLRGTAQVL